MGKFSLRRLFKRNGKIPSPDPFSPVESPVSEPASSVQPPNPPRPSVTLPVDLIPLITSLADQPTLAVLCRTTKYFNQLAIPLLYKHIKLHTAEAVKYFCLYMFYVQPEHQIRMIRSIHIHFELLTWDVDLWTLREEWPELKPKPWSTAILENLHELIITSSGPQRIAGNGGVTYTYRTQLDDLVNDWMKLLVGHRGAKRFSGKHYVLDTETGERVEDKEGVNWAQNTLFNLMCRWERIQYLSLPIQTYDYRLQSHFVAAVEAPKGPLKFLKEVEIHSTNFEQFGGNGAPLVSWLDTVSRRNSEWMDSLDEQKRRDREWYASQGIEREEEEEVDRRIILRIREPTEGSSTSKVQSWIDAKDSRKRVYKTADEGRVLGS
ncbi:hypothetical protein I302_108781 [Kwoniella bestiolae CBS 10118]|uniref:F-box domain-containing protein n=1 Tax=Kwoniella bestiolae CBS 10118 TaxID=1296100 RepID=A0A1B9FU25_9TREE|nr:hypothetical protein I302_07918 [Kwoniella bestiolae CBS 10118]OCF22273.1 hypothetical protein I302_07918 [Kwoniella bestiolae CBS 10118]